MLIRPHPQNAEQWRDFEVPGVVNVAVYPPAGAPPIDAATRADYFDSIYHSAAVVGVNTTAEIESAIVGRNVYSWLAPEFRETQGGTLHFHHLERDVDGLLHAADTFSEHVSQLDAALREPPDSDSRSRRFVETFVRPHGLDVPSTGVLVEALEAAGAAPVRASRPAAWAPLVRFALSGRAARTRRDAITAAAEKARRAKAKRKARTARATRQHARERRMAARGIRCRHTAKHQHPTRAGPPRRASTWSRS